jgi:hypothetical protein
MNKHSIGIEGFGDSCARSHRIFIATDELTDPEVEFEAELLAALEKAKIATQSAE